MVQTPQTLPAKPKGTQKGKKAEKSKRGSREIKAEWKSWQSEVIISFLNE